MAPLVRRALFVALSVLGAVAAPADDAGADRPPTATPARAPAPDRAPAAALDAASAPGPATSDTSSSATADPGDPSALPPGPVVSATPPLAADPSPPAPVVTGDVTWRACRDGDIAPDALGAAGCARVAVPLDHDRPEGATIGVALLRWPAGDPARRLGALFVNPGGPGGSGVALARNAPALVDPEVLARYDIIGFDPRGVGASDGLACGVADRLLAPVGPPADPLAAQVAYGAALAAACDDEHPGLLVTLDTLTTARDLDAVREAVGEPRLHYLGYSYGTALGATYARLFPEHTGRMVLDGPADPSPAYLEWVAAQLTSFEAVLEHFLDACDGTPRCPLAGRARATWATLLERAGDDGLAVPGAEPMDRAELLDATIDLLHLGTAHHELLAGALANAAAGDASGLAEFSRKRSGLSAAAYYGTVCGDDPARPDAAVVAARIERLRADAPTFAPQLREVLTCSGLDRAVSSPPPPAPTTGSGNPPGRPPTAPPALLVATRHDPATPYLGALALQGALTGASLLTWDAVGHTIVGHGEPCVEAAVRAYLLTDVLPAAGATCRPVEAVGVRLDLHGTPRVAGVLEGSPAAGVLRVGDVIHSVAGRAVTGPMQLDEVASAGDGTVSIGFERPGEPGGVRRVELHVDPVPYWRP